MSPVTDNSLSEICIYLSSDHFTAAHRFAREARMCSVPERLDEEPRQLAVTLSRSHERVSFSHQPSNIGRRPGHSRRVLGVAARCDIV